MLLRHRSAVQRFVVNEPVLIAMAVLIPLLFASECCANMCTEVSQSMDMCACACACVHVHVHACVGAVCGVRCAVCGVRCAVVCVYRGHRGRQMR